MQPWIIKKNYTFLISMAFWRATVDHSLCCRKSNKNVLFLQALVFQTTHLHWFLLFLSAKVCFCTLKSSYWPIMRVQSPPTDVLSGCWEGTESINTSDMDVFDFTFFICSFWIFGSWSQSLWCCHVLYIGEKKNILQSFYVNIPERMCLFSKCNRLGFFSWTLLRQKAVSVLLIFSSFCCVSVESSVTVFYCFLFSLICFP